MTMCNMSIEAGARAGMFAPDAVTFAYLSGLPHAPTGPAWEEALVLWRSLVTDPGAVHDRTVAVDQDLERRQAHAYSTLGGLAL